MAWVARAISCPVGRFGTGIAGPLSLLEDSRGLNIRCDRVTGKTKNQTAFSRPSCWLALFPSVFDFLSTCEELLLQKLQGFGGNLFGR